MISVQTKNGDLWELIHVSSMSPVVSRLYMKKRERENKMKLIGPFWCQIQLYSILFIPFRRIFCLFCNHLRTECVYLTVECWLCVCLISLKKITATGEYANAWCRYWSWNISIMALWVSSANERDILACGSMHHK